MIRQFLRLYLTIMIPVVVVVGLVHHFGAHEVARNAYVEGLRAGLHDRFAATCEQVAALKLDDWEGSLPRIRAAFPADLRFEPLPTAARRVEGNADEASHFDQGDVAFSLSRRGLSHAYQRIPGTSLTIGTDVEVPSRRALSPMTLYVSVALVIASVVLLGLWFRRSWRALERLGVLTEQVASTPGRRVDATSRFGFPLVTTIDRMTSRLDELLSARRTQSNSVAHELTAPIAQLSFALEMLKEDPAGAKSPALLARMREDLQELDELVAESLEYARLGSGSALTLAWTRDDVLLRDAVAVASRQGRRSTPIDLIWAPGAPQALRCDGRQTSRALSNLVRNAVRHASTRVALSSERRDGCIWFHVDDDGDGIPEADRAGAFEPFTRLDNHSVGASRGYGLGLAIVRQVADLHGGATAIARSPLGGARVSIGLPVDGPGG